MRTRPTHILRTFTFVTFTRLLFTRCRYAVTRCATTGWLRWLRGLVTDAFAVTHGLWTRTRVLCRLDGLVVPTLHTRPATFPQFTPVTHIYTVRLVGTRTFGTLHIAAVWLDYTHYGLHSYPVVARWTPLRYTPLLVTFTPTRFDAAHAPHTQLILLHFTRYVYPVVVVAGWIVATFTLFALHAVTRYTLRVVYYDFTLLPRTLPLR